MRTPLLLSALLAAALAAPALASEIGVLGEGARHPSYTPNRFEQRSTGAGRNDALGKTHKEIGRGRTPGDRDLGRPGTPGAWDTDGDGKLSEQEYRQGYYGRYKGRDPTLVDDGRFTIIERRSEAERQLER